MWSICMDLIPIELCSNDEIREPLFYYVLKYLANSCFYVLF